MIDHTKAEQDMLRELAANDGELVIHGRHDSTTRTGELMEPETLTYTVTREDVALGSGTTHLPIILALTSAFGGVWQPTAMGVVQVKDGKSREWDHADWTKARNVNFESEFPQELCLVEEGHSASDDGFGLVSTRVWQFAEAVKEANGESDEAARSEALAKVSESLSDAADFVWGLSERQAELRANVGIDHGFKFIPNRDPDRVRYMLREELEGIMQTGISVHGPTFAWRLACTAALEAESVHKPVDKVAFAIWSSYKREGWLPNDVKPPFHMEFGLVTPWPEIARQYNDVVVADYKAAKAKAKEEAKAKRKEAAKDKETKPLISDDAVDIEDAIAAALDSDFAGDAIDPEDDFWELSGSDLMNPSK